ncbi:Dam family site-specific DNA-(adenine-N6)-methyltransferase [Candidatus Bathyarchaeota archaeon]|nr:MAG: Dam family site-specific DNA-(adenine-N6)-methyltransferase [Candidatus Bathyarchaeota archaeon]TMI31481.1 MAG: Dam family site-specific DNA-(adenine-N6)-methyltransferase [Candidatus Bathyarchaeota archaeon]
MGTEAQLEPWFSAPPSPYLKWAGGKSQLLETFTGSYPPSFRRYFEPFLGGGAVFFHLCGLRKIQWATVSDSNKALINCYVAIRDNLEKLIGKLARLQEHSKDKDFYYKYARPTFNAIRLKTGLEGDIEKAALLIYLNKTCFNGLYRVNSRGQFNVPWGSHRNPQIYDEETLRAVREWLRPTAVQLLCADFRTVLVTAEKNDFAYIDPPYQPISTTSSFTDYTSQGFSFSDQKRLAQCVAELDAKGCYVMVSNSAHEYVKRLYEKVGKKGHFETVYAARAISSVGTGRGNVPEYLITNYRTHYD